MRYVIKQAAILCFQGPVSESNSAASNQPTKSISKFRKSMKAKREKGEKKWKQIKRDGMTFEKYGNEENIETELIAKIS